MKFTKLTRLVSGVATLLFTACASGPALPSVTPTETAAPTITAAPPSALLPTPSPSPILLPTPFPSPTGAARPPTAVRTATSPARTATSRPHQTPVSPTVASEGWDTHTLLVGPGNPGRLYALQGERDARYFNSEKRRLLISDDLGETWRPFPGGLPVPPICLANVDLDYASRDALYASTCQGLFRWGGNKWMLISSQETRQVAIVYGRPQQMWALASPQKGGPVLRSDDGGKTWRGASDNLAHFAGLATIAVDPRNAQTVYGIIVPKYAGTYLRRMFVDNPWHTMPTPLDNRQIDIGMTIDGATGDLYVTVYTQQAWQLWRTRNPQVSDEKAVVWEKVSDFEADLWATVLASGGAPQGLALFVRMAPTNCSSYDALCDTFVQRSVDGGKTWKRLVIR